MKEGHTGEDGGDQGWEREGNEGERERRELGRRKG